jgi:hypothetical protein
MRHFELSSNISGTEGTARQLPFWTGVVELRS